MRYIVGYKPDGTAIYGEDDEDEQVASVADTEAANRQAVEDARRAIADGRRIFLCRVPMMYDRLIAVGTAGLSGPSSVIEAIENLGWRLDQMSWVARPVSPFRAEGIFLSGASSTSLLWTRDLPLFSGLPSV